MANLLIIDSYSFTRLIDQLRRLVDTFEMAIKRVVNEQNEDFNALLQYFDSNIVTILNNGNLGSELNNLFTAYLIVADNPNDQYKLLKALFNFDDNNTANDLSKNESNNFNTIKNSIQIFSLAGAFESASKISYGNENDLNTIKKELNSQYEKLIIKDIDQNTRVSLLDIKTNTFKLFSELDLSEVVMINTKTVPSSVLAYRYYKDSSRSNEIINLNNSLNTGFIDGDIKVVSPS